MDYYEARSVLIGSKPNEYQPEIKCENIEEYCEAVDIASQAIKEAIALKNELRSLMFKHHQCWDRADSILCRECAYKATNTCPVNKGKKCPISAEEEFDYYLDYITTR